MSTYLADIGREGLGADLTITPGGGAQKISYMVALLSSQELNVLVLLDDEKEAKATKQELVVRNRLISEQSVIFVSEAFADEVPKESDIEDLFTPAIYESLVQESYAKELEGRCSLNRPNFTRYINGCFLISLQPLLFIGPSDCYGRNQEGAAF